MNDFNILARLLLAQRDTMYRTVIDHIADDTNDLSTEDAAGIAGEVANAYTHEVITVLRQFGWRPPATSEPIEEKPADQTPPPSPV